jgi:sialidase-1
MIDRTLFHLVMPVVVALALPGARAFTIAAEPFLEKVDLFEAGKGGYALYRIPGIVAISKTTVLAYCEARKNAGGDWGHIDILMRRSSDGGKTWTAPRQVVHLEGKFERNPAAVAQNLGKPGEITVNNPVAIVDRKGPVHFLYCVEYGRCFYMRSEDDGVSYTQPVEITSAFAELRRVYPWQVFATGPGHGIQLTSGRLLVPVWLSRGTGGHAHRPSVVSTLFSDDGGKHWHCGDIVANETDPLTNPNESIALQLADGRVMLNMRSESRENRRTVAFSKDGATGWSRPVFHDQLLEPVCMAATARLTAAPLNRNRILFTNPHNLDRADGQAKPGGNRDRRNLSIKLSYDESKTWPINKTLEPGTSGYSDLAVASDGTILCLYERGSTAADHFRTNFLTIARFNLEWLTDRKDTVKRRE